MSNGDETCVKKLRRWNRARLAVISLHAPASANDELNMVTTIHAVTNILRQNAVSRDRMDLAEENMVILEENGRVVVTRKNRVTRILVVGCVKNFRDRGDVLSMFFSRRRLLGAFTY